MSARITINLVVGERSLSFASTKITVYDGNVVTLNCDDPMRVAFDRADVFRKALFDITALDDSQCLPEARRLASKALAHPAANGVIADPS